MVQTVKSVLFFDHDSLYRSLEARASGGAANFAARIGGFIAAMESGEVILPKPAEPIRRRILVKRCYADPKLLGANRGFLAANGVQVVDCPTLAGHARSAADIHMVLDAEDALGHATGYDEFILLTADSDLTPLLFRLRAHNRNAIVYANGTTTDAYRAFAEGAVEEELILGLLGIDPSAPRPARPQAAPAPVALRSAGAAAAKAEPQPAAKPEAALPVRGEERAPADREALSTVVKRIHTATRVPLFSPKVYAELFSALAEEIAENGYRFQTTAENVAERLATLGRNVARRQVGFVVKGLALKGHIFTANDTAEQLASVFREQVLYLARNANLALNERELALISAWITGHAAHAELLAPAATKPTQPAIAMPASTPTAAPSLARRKIEPVQAPAAAQPAPTAAPQTATASPASEPAKPAAAPARKPILRTTLRTRVAEPAPEPEVEAAPAEPAPAAAAVQPAAATARPTAAGRRAAPAAERPAEKPQAAPPPAAEPDPEPEEDMESSILAAIAEAVDVMVEDTATDKMPPEPAQAPAPQPAPQAQRSRRDAAPLAAKPAEPVSDAAIDDDIGDEIQRIIASYSLNRQQTTRK